MREKIPDRISEYINFRNNQKHLFTAGPASLTDKNLKGLRPCFGRGDKDYEDIENFVLNKLRDLSGHEKIIRFQGSASLALEIITLNFLYGDILIISTGYYSDRLIKLVNSAKKSLKKIKKIDIVEYKELDKISGRYNWIVSCYTETSRGLKISLKTLKSKASQLKSKIMLDATASIGLESDHFLADVIGYSSCKGLFGLTGAAFIAYNKDPINEVDSFYLNFENHLEKRMTGPYHAICSLFEILKDYEKYKNTVIENKKKFLIKFKKYINIPIENQPLLCTFTTCRVLAETDKAILYSPRDLKNGSIVCHLGEVHLGELAKGELINILQPSESN